MKNVLGHILFYRFGCPRLYEGSQLELMTFSQCLRGLRLCLGVSHFVQFTCLVIFFQEASSTFANNQHNSSSQERLFLPSSQEIDRLKFLNQFTETTISNLRIGTTSASAEDIKRVDISRRLAYRLLRSWRRGFQWWITYVKVYFRCGLREDHA